MWPTVFHAKKNIELASCILILPTLWPPCILHMNDCIQTIFRNEFFSVHGLSRLSLEARKPTNMYSLILPSVGLGLYAICHCEVGLGICSAWFLWAFQLGKCSLALCGHSVLEWGSSQLKQFGSWAFVCLYCTYLQVTWNLLSLISFKPMFLVVLPLAFKPVGMTFLHIHVNPPGEFTMLSDIPNLVMFSLN